MRTFQTRGGKLTLDMHGEGVELVISDTTGNSAVLTKLQAMSMTNAILRHYGVLGAAAPMPGQIWTLEDGQMILILDDRHFIKLNSSAQTVGPVEVTKTVQDRLVLMVSEASCIHKQCRS